MTYPLLYATKAKALGRIKELLNPSMKSGQDLSSLDGKHQRQTPLTSFLCADHFVMRSADSFMKEPK